MMVMSFAATLLATIPVTSTLIIVMSFAANTSGH
jgi:hypothetical protein